MPKFPAYPADLPTVLNPLDPRHYWLLFKWMFFQPSKLKQYLFGVDPQSYYATGHQALFSFRDIPGYRELCFITLGLTITISVILTLILSIAEGIPVDWWKFVQGIGLSLGIGIILGSVWGGVWGLALGVVLGSTGIVSLGIVLGTAGGMGFNLVFVLFFGVGITTILGVVGNVALGVVLGILLGIALVFFALIEHSEVMAMTGGVIILGATRTPFWLFELIFAELMILIHHEPPARLPNHPIIWDEMIIWPFYRADRFLDDNLQQAGITATLSHLRKIVANPFQRWSVQRTLSDYMIKGCIDAAHMGFHDYAQSRRALRVHRNLEIGPLASMLSWSPFPFINNLLSDANLDEYLLPPVSQEQLSKWPSARNVMFGELAGAFIDGTGGYSRIPERFAWLVTRSRRWSLPVAIVRYCNMLYLLLSDKSNLEELKLSKIHLAERFASNYEGVRVYPQGDEVANSWASLAALLGMITLEQLGTAHEQLTWIPQFAQPYLSPAIIATLIALGDVSRSVAACLQATSLPNKTVALNQAAGGLNELSIYAQTELCPPERALFGALIKHWQSLIASEQGRLGANALQQMSPSERLATGLVDRTSDVWQRPAKPLTNPYIAGDPVMPPLFVGRRDIFTRINEIWRAKSNPDSIILYGHRRMGKSSILRNLDQAAPGRVIAYVNLQGETSFVASTADLLLALADRIYAEVKRARPETALTQPPADQFATPASAQIQFNRFMEQVRGALGDSGLILALDEFEAIEEAVRDGKVGKEIYQFLRAKTQEPWITVVFGGLHTLDEMSRDYAQPFYGSYQNIVVSYLAPEDAYHLITNPTPDFTVNYEPAAVDRIIAATGGQPYLVQLVCRDALDHLNHELFDEHKEREVKLTLADVEAVLGDDLFRRGTGYFDGVWTQVSEAAQQDLLRCMAQHNKPWTLTELQEATHHSSEELHQHLQLAERRDILRQRDDGLEGTWEFCVPLMRRWIIWKE